MKLISATILFFMLTIPSTKAGDTTSVLHYLVKEPKIQSAHPPTIILLHGVGSNEEDLFSFANHLPEKYLVISARAPIGLGGNSYAWYHLDFSTGKPVFNFEEEESSRATLIKFISQVKEKYSADANEIYLCGFSQGAIMSYSIALTRPDLVKGIAVMSGRLLEEIKPFITSKDKLQKLKVFISHGTKDNVLPVQNAREAAAFLKTLNINFSYKEYPEEHTISNEMFSDLLQWLK
ncbi:MAG: dienelactone hydrolase family protein [Bacteroidia bacterium]